MEVGKTDPRGPEGHWEQDTVLHRPNYWYIDYHCLNNVIYRGATRQNYIICLHYFDGSESDFIFLTSQI